MVCQITTRVKTTNCRFKDNTPCSTPPRTCRGCEVFLEVATVLNNEAYQKLDEDMRIAQLAVVSK